MQVQNITPRKLTKEQRSEQARSGAIKRWQRVRETGTTARITLPLTVNERQQRYREDQSNQSAIKARDKARKEEFRAMGMCVSCYTKPARTNRIHCEECAKLSSGYAIRRSARLVGAGLCSKCGTTAFTTKLGMLCETCYLKKRSRSLFGVEKYWSAIRDKLISQDFKCAYTGVLIELGVNDSVDHSFPSSRFPERLCDMSNIEWVTRDINAMKRALTPEEFIALIEIILAYRNKKKPRPSNVNVEVFDSCVV